MTDSVAAALLDHAEASSSTKRVEEASDASAQSTCLAPATATSAVWTAPGAMEGRRFPNPLVREMLTNAATRPVTVSDAG